MKKKPKKQTDSQDGNLGSNSDSSDGLVMPMLPLRDIVIFPNMVVPLFVGRERSIKALDNVFDQNGEIFLATQKDATIDDPKEEDIYDFGVVGQIMQILRLPDGSAKVLIKANKRARSLYLMDAEEYLQADVELLEEQSNKSSKKMQILGRTAISLFEEYVKLHYKINVESITAVSQMEDLGNIADAICSYLHINLSRRQDLLETLNIEKRINKLIAILESEVEMLSAEKKIRNRVRNQMEQAQREYYLKEQMSAIQKELGDPNKDDDLDELSNQIHKIAFPKDVKKKAVSELKKLKAMNPSSSEANVLRNYLEWLTEVPWNKFSKTTIDLEKSEKLLNKDHFAMEKPKERIIEHLAVQKRNKYIKGQILCFVGPPGVGKTSIAKSIAEATGRKFIKISLGGLKDESEIRGHRRTYIGSQPGRIVQAMKKAGTNNPLILLDEIDKMGVDYRTDPSSAMLEVLDPEQNKKFNDNYLEVDYDISNVMFVATANNLHMQRPLLDRMEVIRLSGYTEDEKIEIAKKHLIPKQLKEHNLKRSEFSLSDVALRNVIWYYTRESGVRNLEREIAKLARKTVTQLVRGNVKKISITAKNLQEFLGIQKFEHSVSDKEDRIGTTTGLAYTESGGDLLPVEVVLIPSGKGNITITGKLGDVMQESAKVAWGYVRSYAYQFGIESREYHKCDIHIHVPEGAVPKDGPSAGVALATSLISALTGIKVKKTIAMTGEISLRGMVLPIGGLKEKLLAAVRGGIQEVVIPHKNVKDLEEIPANVKEQLEIIPVKTIAEVFAKALVKRLSPTEWKIKKMEEIDNINQKEAEQTENIIKH